MTPWGLAERTKDCKLLFDSSGPRSCDRFLLQTADRSSSLTDPRSPTL